MSRVETEREARRRAALGASRFSLPPYQGGYANVTAEHANSSVNVTGDRVETTARCASEGRQGRLPSVWLGWWQTCLRSRYREMHPPAISRRMRETSSYSSFRRTRAAPRLARCGAVTLLASYLLLALDFARALSTVKSQRCTPSVAHTANVMVKVPGCAHHLFLRCTATHFIIRN